MFDYSFDSKAEVFEHQFNQEEVERLNSLRNSGYGPLECLLSVLADRQATPRDICECVVQRYSGSTFPQIAAAMCVRFNPHKRLVVAELRYPEGYNLRVPSRDDTLRKVRSALRGFDLEKLSEDYPSVDFTVYVGSTDVAGIKFPTSWLIPDSL